MIKRYIFDAPEDRRGVTFEEALDCDLTNDNWEFKTLKQVAKCTNALTRDVYEVTFTYRKVSKAEIRKARGKR